MPRKKTILIIEDELSQLKVLRHEFEDQGFDVLFAHNGQDGIVLALSRHPDIILLDIVMPAMDGETLLAVLRRDRPWGKDVPVVILTNVIPDENKMKTIRKHGVKHYLVKSGWPLEAVVDCVKRELVSHGRAKTIFDDLDHIA